MEHNSNLIGFPEKGVKDFPIRLREIIGESTLKDFAEKIGMSEGGLRKYLPPAKSSPSFERVVAMATLTGVEVEWLSTGRGPKFAGEQAPRSSSHGYAGEGLAKYSTASSFDEEFALIDGYHVAIGEIGCSLDKLQVRRKLAFRHKWLEWRGFEPENLKVFFVKSYLEGGTISGGDSVMINTSDTRPTDGVFAIYVNESILIRWFSIRVDGTVEVYKDINKEVTEVISQEAFKNIKILGRVVWLGKDFK